jgi:FtsH-binding integral membrane protein
MNTPNLGYRVGAGAQTGAIFDEGLRQHMLRVYNYMGVGLVVTGLVAFMISSDAGALRADLLQPAEMGGDAGAARLRHASSRSRCRPCRRPAAQAMFWAFCAVMGLSLASVFLVFTGTSIARTFFIAATMFGATSLYGYTTKRDLTQFSARS